MRRLIVDHINTRMAGQRTDDRDPANEAPVVAQLAPTRSQGARDHGSAEGREDQEQHGGEVHRRIGEALARDDDVGSAATLAVHRADRRTHGRDRRSQPPSAERQLQPEDEPVDTPRRLGSLRASKALELAAAFGIQLSHLAGEMT